MPTQEQQLEATLRTALKREPPPTEVTTAAQGPLAGRSADRAAFILKVDRIRPNADQVRRMGKGADDPKNQELAESIQQIGLQNALDVHWVPEDDIYELAAGERRYVAATKILHWTEIPVRIVNATEEELIWLQLHENIHRADLHPLDLAQAVQTLIGGGTSLADIARKLCKSETWVQKALTVAQNLAPEAKTEVQAAERTIGMESVYEVAQVPSQEQLPLVRRIVAEGLNRKQVRELTSPAKKAQRHARPSKGGRPATARPYCRTFKTANGATVTIEFRKTRASLEEVAGALRSALKQLSA